MQYTTYALKEHPLLLTEQCQIQPHRQGLEVLGSVTSLVTFER